LDHEVNGLGKEDSDAIIQRQPPRDQRWRKKDPDGMLQM
jgi:hypothetical protein